MNVYIESMLKRNAFDRKLIELELDWIEQGLKDANAEGQRLRLREAYANTHPSLRGQSFHEWFQVNSLIGINAQQRYSQQQLQNAVTDFLTVLPFFALVFLLGRSVERQKQNGKEVK